MEYKATSAETVALLKIQTRLIMPGIWLFTARAPHLVKKIAIEIKAERITRPSLQDVSIRKVSHLRGNGTMTMSASFQLQTWATRYSSN
jgi:hypothetical protein